MKMIVDVNLNHAGGPDVDPNVSDDVQCSIRSTAQSIAISTITAS